MISNFNRVTLCIKFSCRL